MEASGCSAAEHRTVKVRALGLGLGSNPNPNPNLPSISIVREVDVADPARLAHCRLRVVIGTAQPERSRLRCQLSSIASGGKELQQADDETTGVAVANEE